MNPTLTKSPLNNNFMDEVQTFSDVPKADSGVLETVANSTKYTATFRVFAMKELEKRGHKPIENWLPNNTDFYFSFNH